MRKLVVHQVLIEDIHRADNAYASLTSALTVNPALAAQLASGALFFQHANISCLLIDWPVLFVVILQRYRGLTSV